MANQITTNRKVYQIFIPKIVSDDHLYHEIKNKWNGYERLLPPAKDVLVKQGSSNNYIITPTYDGNTYPITWC